MRLIVFSDGLIALITLALAIAFARGGKALWLVFLTSALRAVGTAVQGPAVGAIVPRFVPLQTVFFIDLVTAAIVLFHGPAARLPVRA